MLRDKLHEIILGIAGEGGFAEMPVVRQKGRGAGMKVGEITAPTTGNPDLFGRFSGVIKDQHRAATPPGHPATHQSGSAAADNHNITCFRHDKT
jgi:hypothetical protein